MKNRNNSTFLIKSTKNESFGTGFCIHKKTNGSFLLTCAHVVEECEDDSIEVDGKKAELLYKGSSQKIDLALLYVEGLMDTEVLNLCSDTINEGVLFKINGFKPHRKESFKFETLDGVVKKISQIQIDHEKIETYELSMEKENIIEKGYSGSAVVLQGTNKVIAVATDRARNGKDAYAIPITYIKSICGDMPDFISCREEMRYKDSGEKSFLKRMEDQALNTIGGVIVMAVITGFIYDAIKPNDTTEETVKIEAKKTNTNLEEIKKLIKANSNDNEEEFLKKYFGKNYKIIVENPQTYHNFTTLLKNSHKTLNELLEEREQLLKKISLQSLNGNIQKMIDKAFAELRYDDVRDLLDNFIKTNQDIGEELIKAHYQKALTYIEEIEYHKAKAEFEQFIPFGIKDAKILHDYGGIYYELGEYDKAIELYNRALKIQIATLGENHYDTATSYNSIGLVWKSKGEYDKAIEFYNKALKIQIATVGENNSSTAISYNNIGSAWHSKMAYDKAMEFYNRALKIQIAILGENHPDTATSYNNIGTAWSDKGEYNKAIEFYNKALKIQIATLAKNHPDIATSYFNIGLVWKYKGEYDKAIEFYNKDLEINIVTLGENHPLTASSYNNIGILYYKMKKYQKAYEFIERAVKIMEVTLPKTHPDLIHSKQDLETVKSRLE